LIKEGLIKDTTKLYTIDLTPKLLILKVLEPKI